VVEQPLGEREELGLALPVAEDLEQRG